MTYFLTKDEIRSVIRALSLKGQDFVQLTRRIAAEAGTGGSLCHFYVVGTVSSGKSSLIERLRSLRTYEEWPETPLELMFKDSGALTPDEKVEVDAWVQKQLAEKNRLMRDAQYGIHIMDRAPLDMFAFSQDAAENAGKARELGVRVGDEGLKAGGVILLAAAPDVLFERQVRRGRGPEWLANAAYREETLGKQSDGIRAIYQVDDALDTSRLSIDEVARRAAERILFDDFAPVNLEQRRISFEAGERIDA